MSIALDVSRQFPRSATPYGKAAELTVVGGKDAADDAQALQRVGIRLRFARGETIFSEGDEAKYSYKVVSGAIRLCKHLADGRRQIAGFVLPGEYCGFMHLDEHRFTAESTGDTVLIAYPQRQIEVLAQEMPSVQKRLTGFLANRLKSMQDHVVLLGRLTARERVASLLLLLAERAGTGGKASVALPMSRQDMADYLGLTIETVCRVLSDLKRLRVIELPDLHVMRIRDLDGLGAVAEGLD